MVNELGKLFHLCGDENAKIDTLSCSSSSCCQNMQPHRVKNRFFISIFRHFSRSVTDAAFSDLQRALSWWDMGEDVNSKMFTRRAHCVIFGTSVCGVYTVSSIIRCPSCTFCTFHNLLGGGLTSGRVYPCLPVILLSHNRLTVTGNEFSSCSQFTSNPLSNKDHLRRHQSYM